MRAPQRKTTIKNKYITRMDYANTHGYNVRIPSKEKDKYESFFFADGEHGGKRQALKVARTFRDDAFKDRGIQGKISPCKTGPHSHQGNNSSGIIGVFEYYDRTASKNPMGWSAVWYRDPQSHVKRFPFSKYSEGRAFELACIERIIKSGPLTIVNPNKKFPLSLSQIKELNEVYGHGNL